MKRGSKIVIKYLSIVLICCFIFSCGQKNIVPSENPLPPAEKNGETGNRLGEVEDSSSVTKEDSSEDFSSVIKSEIKLVSD